jgi:hypothetical protein
MLPPPSSSSFSLYLKKKKNSIFLKNKILNFSLILKINFEK